MNKPRPLHVIIVNPHAGGDPRDPDIFLNRHPRLTGWADAVSAQGARVTVCQRYHRSAERTRGDVKYRFIAGHAQGLIRGGVRVGDEAASLANRAAEAGDVVVHVNGLTSPGIVRRLAGRLGPNVALVAQHHTERPRSPLVRAIQRHAFQRVDGFLFSHRDNARTWQMARVVPESASVHEVPVASSQLEALTPERARRRHGLAGDPVVLWTGDLSRGKDPLTVLEGFRRFAASHPAAHLYMAFRDDHLRHEVEAARDQAGLETSVTLMGERPYSSMPALYSGADIFVQGSREDTCGVAVLDAMSCGAVPVVTNIPTFRAMLGERDGSPKVGALWTPGDPDACAAALTDVTERCLRSECRRSKERFTTRWSWAAIGDRAVGAYREAIRRREALSSEDAIVLAGSAS